MPRYRKRLRESEVLELTMETYEAISTQLQEAGFTVRTFSEPPMRELSGIIIERYLGERKVFFGDYIININGGFYPCAREHFDAIYQIEE